MNETDWERTATLHMKSEMTKRGLNIPKLTELFLARGYNVTLDGIRGKIDRGKFSFTFYLQFLHVIGAKKLELIGLGNIDEMDIRIS